MSSLFDHHRDSALSPFNKICRVRNKNKAGHKNILLNVKSFKSPDARSPSLRKRSTSRLFKDAHRIPSETTQETTSRGKSQNDFLFTNPAEIQKMASSTKTRRLNTLEEKKKKITLRKKLSLGNNIEKTVSVCVNGQNVMDTNEADLLDSLTKLIMEDCPQNSSNKTGDLDSILGENRISEDSFELEIDSNLVSSNPELLEWSELIKRI